MSTLKNSDLDLIDACYWYSSERIFLDLSVQETLFYLGDKIVYYFPDMVSESKSFGI